MGGGEFCSPFQKQFRSLMETMGYFLSQLEFILYWREIFQVVLIKDDIRKIQYAAKNRYCIECDGIGKAKRILSKKKCVNNLLAISKSTGNR